MRIEAAVLRAADAPYTIEPLELADPGPGEVVVRITGAGHCHTDLLGRMPGDFPKPVVLGHEGSGVVEAVGPGVTGVAAGTPVVLSFDSCGACGNCHAARARASSTRSTPPRSPRSSPPPSPPSRRPGCAGWRAWGSGSTGSIRR
jgi:aryl-alcohol dehydrogenase